MPRFWIQHFKRALVIDAVAVLAASALSGDEPVLGQAGQMLGDVLPAGPSGMHKLPRARAAVGREP